MAENAELVRAWQRAASLGRVEDLLSLSHPEFEMTEASALPGASRVTGLEALRSYCRGWARNWSEWEWREEELIELPPDRVVLDATLRLRGLRSSIWVEHRWVYLFVIRDGLIARNEGFLSKEEALGAHTGHGIACVPTRGRPGDTGGAPGQGAVLKHMGGGCSMTKTRGLILALLAALLTSAGCVTVNAVISAGTAAANSPLLTEEQIEIRELAREKEKERLAKARERAKAIREKAAEKEKELALAAREKAKEKKVAEHEESKRLLEEAKADGNLPEVEAEVQAKEEKAKEEASALREKERAKAMLRHEKLNARVKAFLEKAREKAREHRAIDEEHLREKKEKEKQRALEREEREKRHEEEVERKEKERLEKAA